MCFGVGRPSANDRSKRSLSLHVHVHISYYYNGLRKRCSFLDGHGSFACEVKYFKAIVYGRFTLAIVMVKRPYTIGV